MKKLPIGMQDFKKLITEGNIYIDKTEQIYNIISEGSYYFLSRPRRFGKSLLISTLKEIFCANRELFKNLWIYESAYDWQEYPVIHIDLSLISEGNINDFKLNLTYLLNNIARNNNINTYNAPTPITILAKIVEELSKKNKVVLLIDEYDKPLLDNINDLKKAEEFRDYLKVFYSVIKGLDSYLKFVFITGVTKFSKTSIFSGLNNLLDLSITKEASTLVGYTHKEINKYFIKYLEDFSLKENIEVSEILVKMKMWYNGYRFCEEEIRVYNPFSILYCLKKYKFKNYWFETGTPSFLISLLKNQYYELIDIPISEISSSSLGTFDIDNIPLIPLLFQTGYLTIENYNKETENFTLNFPNFEVEDSFRKFLVTILTYQTLSLVNTNIANLINYLFIKDLDNFCKTIQILFAKIPNSLAVKKENYFHALFQFLMSLLSLKVRSEVLTNIGRIDTVLEIKNLIYIFELKLNTDPQIALNQIHQRRYYEVFLDQDKEIILVGLSFKYGENSFSVEHKTEIFNGE